MRKALRFQLTSKRCCREMLVVDVDLLMVPDAPERCGSEDPKLSQGIVELL